MAVLVLVHGAHHDGGSWAPLVAALEGRGHRCRTPDLPVDDPRAGAAAYADAVTAAVADVPGPVVAVGHSQAGLVLPLLPERRPVAALVYLCAVLPDIGRSLHDQLRALLGVAELPIAPGLVHDDDGVAHWADRDAAAAAFYPDLDPAARRPLAARLRPQAATPLRERTPLSQWPDVPSYVLVGEHDRLTPVWGPIARERLGVEPDAVPGAHFPFLTDPAAVADRLDAIAGHPANGVTPPV